MIELSLLFIFTGIISDLKKKNYLIFKHNGDTILRIYYKWSKRKWSEK